MDAKSVRIWSLIWIGGKGEREEWHSYCPNLGSFHDEGHICMSPVKCMSGRLATPPQASQGSFLRHQLDPKKCQWECCPLLICGSS